jgi:DUF2075 family protein
MIVYESNVDGFRLDVLGNRIEEQIRSRFETAVGHSVSPAEIRSWQNSLAHMDRVLSDSSVPGDAGVAVEFFIPGSTKRMDFVLTGLSPAREKTAVLIELKQWDTVRRTEKDAIVETFLGGGLRETSHPSYQAWSYASLLEGFNQAVQESPIRVHPCAYLHNCESASVIRDPFYREHTTRAPVFLRDDASKLREFLRQHIRYGDGKSVMYEILHGSIRPSKNLADCLVSLLKGNPEFTLIDDQKLVFETARLLAQKAQHGKKQVFRVEGGPGTGKSVVAINLLVRLTEARLNARYITKNQAPRAVYEARLTGTLKKKHISNLFSGPDGLHATTPNTFDALILDEAHRLRAKSGLFANLGENQIAEAIRAARFTVFFVDDAQQVTLKDIGALAEIRRLAEASGAEVTRLCLESQFRCNGSDGFLGWVDHTLGIRQTANTTLEEIDYDFRVCDDPEDLRILIEEKNLAANRARLVAGYCWDWKSKKNPRLKDIEIEGFSARWNLTKDGMTWILSPDSVREVGCIHTCQGLEVDYVGVILGNDYVIRNGQWQAHPEHRSSQDRSVHGFRKLLRLDPKGGALRLADIIRNTYRTLMTRGARGCYVYSVDPETRAYLKAAMGSRSRDTSRTAIAPERFQILTPEEAASEPNKARFFQEPESAAAVLLDSLPRRPEWVKLPTWFRAQGENFVIRRVAPGKEWCLFRRSGDEPGATVLVRRNGSGIKPRYGLEPSSSLARVAEEDGSTDISETAEILGVLIAELR